MTTDNSMPAGWYPSPNGGASETYWDGTAWTEQVRAVQIVVAAKPTVTATGEPISPKSRAAAAILAWFLGIFGIHRFYVGKVGTGVAMIFTLGGLGIWALIDFVIIIVGNFRDKEGRVLANW